VSDLCDLTSLDRLSPYSCNIPFEMYISRASLGLTICRKVADMTSDFAFPPVLDSHPPSSGSCWAQKARPYHLHLKCHLLHLPYHF